MPVPMFRGPTYGAEVGSALTTGSAGRLASMLDARKLDVDVLKSLMSNSDKLAAIGGSGLLGNISNIEAGSPEGLFASDYATWADSARQRLTEAEIGAKNRSGTGGGGGGGASGGGLKAGQFVGTDGNVYKWSDFDTTVQANITAGNGPNGLGVLKGGPTYAGGDVTMPTGGPAPAPGKRIVERYEDGSVEYDDGTVGMEGDE